MYEQLTTAQLNELVEINRELLADVAGLDNYSADLARECAHEELEELMTVLHTRALTDDACQVLAR